MSIQTKVNTQDIEQFLYREAQLLDEWRLDEWFKLFADGANYLIPSNDRPDGSPKNTLFLVADDYPRLRARINRLKSPEAHIENPHSRTRRFINNVQIVDEASNTMNVIANFIVYRYRKNEEIGVFTGKFLYKLLQDTEGIKIAEKKALLDKEELGSLRSIGILL